MTVEVTVDGQLSVAVPISAILDDACVRQGFYSWCRCEVKCAQGLGVARLIQDRDMRSLLFLFHLSRFTQLVVLELACSRLLFLYMEWW